MYIEANAEMHRKGTSMGTKVIFVTLVILIAIAGFLLIKSDTPFTLAGETLGSEPSKPVNHKPSKETPQTTKMPDDSKTK